MNFDHNKWKRCRSLHMHTQIYKLFGMQSHTCTNSDSTYLPDLIERKIHLNSYVIFIASIKL